MGNETRDSKGRFKPGCSGNPAGLPVNYWKARLIEAIEKVEQDNDIDYFEALVTKSLSDSSLAAAMTRKLLPDLKAVEVRNDGQPQRLITIVTPSSTVALDESNDAKKESYDL